MAAASAACASDPGFPLPWSAMEQARQHRWADDLDEEGVQRAGIDEQALTSSASANMTMASMAAAAVCDNGRREEAERDCSTRASSECGEEVARLKERWADLSDVDEPSSPMPSSSSRPSPAAAALESAVAAASVYDEEDSYQRSLKGVRQGGRGAKAERTRGGSSSSSHAAWSTGHYGSSAAAGSWEEQWQVPSAQSWSYAGERRRVGSANGNGKARSSWQRPRLGSAPAASSSASSAYDSWQGGGRNGASSSDATSWDNTTAEANANAEDWWQHEKGYHDDWSQQQGWSATRSTGGSSRGNGRRGKWQCQFFVGIQEEEKFQVVRRLLGAHGKHVKAIAEKSKAKLRLRGRGSGFKEGPEKEESKDDLMLCVSATDQYGYTTSVNMLWAHLEEIYKQYAEFSKAEGWREVQLQVNMHEGPRDGSF